MENSALLLPPPYKEFVEPLTAEPGPNRGVPTVNSDAPFFNAIDIEQDKQIAPEASIKQMLGTIGAVQELQPEMIVPSSEARNPLASLEAPIERASPQETVLAADEYGQKVKTYEAPTEQTEGSDIIPGMLQVDESGKLLKKYMAYHKFSGNLIEAYDRWTLKLLPNQLLSRQLIIRKEQTNLLSPIIGYVYVDNSAFYYSPHTPDYCRNHHLTYSAKLKAHLYFYPVNEHQQYRDPPIGMSDVVHLGEITLGLIPIMLGAWLDPVGRLDNREEKMMLGECPFDPLGYFIISGSERQVVIQEKLRVNRFVLVIGDPKGNKLISANKRSSKPRLGVVGRMTCATIRGTSVIKLFENVDSRIDVSLTILGKDRENRPISLGIYQVIRMLAGWYGQKLNDRIIGLSVNRDQQTDPQIIAAYDEEITRLTTEHSLTIQYTNIGAISELICSMTKPNWVKKIRIELFASEAFARSHADDLQMLAEMKKQPNLNPDQSERYMILIDEVIFPQMTKEPVLPRIQFLALLAAQMAECLAGLRSPDDRDAWMNKQMATPARSIEILWAGVWKKMMTDIQNKLDDGKLVSNTIINEFGRNFITEQFQNSFTSSNWGVQSSKMKENITDSIKRGNSIIAIYSSLMRISSQTSKKIKVTNIRMIQGDQVGIVDMVETPEGSACLTLETKILMGNGKHREIGKLKDGDEILSYNHETMETLITPITRYFQRMSEAVIEIVVISLDYSLPESERVIKQRIRCTDDHPFLTINDQGKSGDYVEGGQLRIGDILVMHDGERPSLAMITEIKECDPEIVADFTTMAQTHTMISGGFVTHNCGIVKNKALTCYVSQERDDTIVLMRLTQAKEVYISQIRTQTHTDVCILNGKFLGWCQGSALAKECINLRRQTAFPFDMCVALRDNVLLLHTDGSRPTRPLLIINEETHQLVIEEKNMYHKPWHELISSGCIEYVDALEQHYIYIAESIWALEAIQHEIAQTRIRVQVAEMAINQLQEELTSDLYGLAIPQEFPQVPEPGQGRRPANLEQLHLLQLDDARAQLKQEQLMLRKLERKIQFTHCEIDPQAILGVASSLGPMSNRNQGPRNSYHCLALTEKIMLEDGTFKTMGDIQDGDRVMTMNVYTHELEGSAVFGKFIRDPKDYITALPSSASHKRGGTEITIAPQKQVYRVRTKMEQEILCTGDHAFLTQLGFADAIDLLVDSHYVAIYIPHLDEKIISVPDWKTIAIGNSKCLFVKLESIEVIPDYEGKVGDFTTVSNNHTFITEQGFVTHNCNHLRQALGINNSMIKTRMDTTTKALQEPTPPIFYNQLAPDFGLMELPGGDTVTLALMVWAGYDQEDAIIFNEDAVRRGLFRMIKYRTSETVFKKKANNFEEILINPLQIAPYYAMKGINIPISDPAAYGCLPIGSLPVKPPNMTEQAYIYGLANTGLPIPDCKVRDGDVVIGKLRFIPSMANPTAIQNVSVALGIREKGAIERVYTGYNGDNELIVDVKIRTVRMPQVGDKFSSRNAQKGTIGVILPSSRMPWVGGNNPRTRGMVPDIIVNPHALPSRMTMSMVIEIITSKVAVIRGEAVNSTPYRPSDLNQFRRTLRDYNFNDMGNEIMMHPETGRPLTSQIIEGLEEFNGAKLSQDRLGSQGGENVPGQEGALRAQIYMGPSYYQQLSHHVDEKIQARNVGRYDAKTRQPVKGRKLMGGLKFGEMERDTLISHGASYALVDTLCYRSDRFRTVFCTVCGTYAVNDIVTERVICRVCDTEGEFGISEIPYMFKYFASQMAGVGIILKQRFSRAEDKIPQPLPEPNDDPSDFD